MVQMHLTVPHHQQGPALLNRVATRTSTRPPPCPSSAPCPYRTPCGRQHSSRCLFNLSSTFLQIEPCLKPIIGPWWMFHYPDLPGISLYDARIRLARRPLVNAPAVTTVETAIAAMMAITHAVCPLPRPEPLAANCGASTHKRIVQIAVARRPYQLLWNGA